MAKGYPGRKRARKAFWRGVKSTRFRVPRNPYANPRLRELFDLGRTQAQLTPALLERIPLPGNRRSGNRRGGPNSSSSSAPLNRPPRSSGGGDFGGRGGGGFGGGGGGDFGGRRGGGSGRSMRRYP